MAINSITPRSRALDGNTDSNDLGTVQNGIAVGGRTSPPIDFDSRALLGASLALGSIFLTVPFFRGVPPAFKTAASRGVARWSGEAGEVTAGSGGVSAWIIIWNLAYGIRRARGEDDGWQTAFFIFGLPLTMVSWMFVDSGGNDFFGFDVTPKSHRS